ncbi:metal-dependent hydrolase [Glaciecola sp. SC05]|uniref:metal-dependent hydrolase n=1 Tax=Glaciecola sp. SC05 TaxID=1987355 RepID=UPI0035277E97
MDSVTQIALGGAVGYAVLGKQVGRKAMLWGAILGTLPDLDVLIPYGDAIANFTYHRGFSHSLFVHLLASPFIVWLILSIHRGTVEHRNRWFYLVFLCLTTHAIIDSFTVYGTQLLWPLTEYPFAVSNLFIIDPMVTLPLLFGLVAALLLRAKPASARTCNVVGLTLSCMYMTWSLGAKVYIDNKVKTALAQNNISVTAYMSTPAPFNTLLWRVVAMSDGEYYEAYASVFDTPSEVSLNGYKTSPELLSGLEDAWGVQRLKWFTKGLYSVKSDGPEIIMSDLRMGIECAYAFNFVVAKKTILGPQLVDVEQLTQRPDLSEVNSIFERIWDPSINLAPNQKRLKGCLQ